MRGKERDQEAGAQIRRRAGGGPAHGAQGGQAQAHRLPPFMGKRPVALQLRDAASAIFPLISPNALSFHDTAPDERLNTVQSLKCAVTILRRSMILRGCRKPI